MLPEIKVYKIDYEFIIKNYLDKSLWKKVWNLFVYKEHVFTLNLFQIDTKDDEIVFEICKNNYSICYELVRYNIQNTSIQILMQQINGAIFRCMCKYEQYLIQQTSEYKLLLTAKHEEEDTLRDIATDFLDEHDITNGNIRETYIDAYINKMETYDTKLLSFSESRQYTILTDMFVTFTTITKDEARLESIKRHVCNEENLLEIEKETNEFLERLDTEEYRNELELELEDI